LNSKTIKSIFFIAKHGGRIWILNFREFA